MRIRLRLGLRSRDRRVLKRLCRRSCRGLPGRTGLRSPLASLSCYAHKVVVFLLGHSKVLVCLSDGFLTIFFLERSLPLLLFLRPLLG